MLTGEATHGPSIPRVRISVGAILEQHPDPAEVTLSGRSRGTARGQDLGEQRLHSTTDLVADRTHGLDPLAGRVV